ncbi:MAG: ROK family protein [Phenylobacterium sp.]|uniref:ROK family protein n=1 Tax=Phenylobacterium sp. TaxID=1871053 RepID=UPI0027376015|nr:ROK family protein [Phenylobacterium sp.]MDP3176032.1 ROK family protein [Phenylobacterium sp.]
MIRIGVDFGGTKIEAAALDAQGGVVARVRERTSSDYEQCVIRVVDLVENLERKVGQRAARIGVGGPGSMSPQDSVMRNANSIHLNGCPFPQDLARALGRPVRYANDANCLALSEAADGAGAGEAVVFAVIIGTGCGAGLVIDGRLVEGRNGIAGEFGHNPLPWPNEAEASQPCWCGKRGCLELFASGPGFAREFGPGQTAEEVVAADRAAGGAAITRYIERLGRALGAVVNLLDPDVIVLGGGMSNVPELYERLAPQIARHTFADRTFTPVRKARHGDSSGVRGAAWLWPVEAGD